MLPSNQSLTKSVKLNYLKACVKGDAAKLISSITLTDANYAIAIDLPKQRYENKRSIVQAHLQTVGNQSAMKVESASGLRKLWETTNEHLRAVNEHLAPICSAGISSLNSSTPEAGLLSVALQLRLKQPPPTRARGRVWQWEDIPGLSSNDVMWQLLQ